MNSTFQISTEKSRLDIKLIHKYLCCDSYWAKDRRIETVEKSIENSLCFGVYHKDEQVGFARVVSDFAVFAWIMDVFILEDYRGKGLSKKLMGQVLNHSDLREVQRWGLATKDAHGLYKKFGFRSLKNPENMMENV